MRPGEKVKITMIYSTAIAFHLLNNQYHAAEKQTLIDLYV